MFWAVINSTFPNYKKFMTSKKRKVIYRACKGQTVDVVIEKLQLMLEHCMQEVHLLI